MEYARLQRLSRAECRQLLPGASVGRLAVPAPHFPTLEPVSFAVVEGELIVAVRAGSAGEAVAAETVVTFEADVLDNRAHQGWSVVVSGRVEELDADVAAVVRPQLKPWPVTGTDRLLLIRSERVSGQRVVAWPEWVEGPAAEDGAAGPADTAPPIARRSVGAEEARRLLVGGGQQVGRLVVGVPGEPAVFPLNFVVDGDTIVFRTQVGRKLTAITRSLVTFEVDEIDATGRGWAVAFQGLAQEMIDADPEVLRSRLAGTAVETWPGGERAHVVRITPYRVEGTAWVAAEVAAGAPTPRS